ncbi:hypothetical protein BH20ACI2_BH20ACI2_23890 [soil metagenome]
MNSLKIGVILLGAALFAAACGEGSPNAVNVAVNKTAVSSPQPTATADVIMLGKDLFATNCMICHKEDGTGGPVTIDGKKINPDNLTTDKMKLMTDEKLIGYVTNGVVDEGMPAFKDKLSQEEIRLVVAHIRRLQGP